jgi:predicted nucleic acid-binding protein
MKQFFDTSVLIAAFVEDERHHDECASIVANAKDGIVLAHGMAECFSILTGGRLSVQLSAKVTARLLEANVVNRMKIVTLTPKEILQVLKDSQTLGIRGGGVYDAMHLAAARKAGADEIFTLKLRHFQAFAPDLADRIQVPMIPN